VAPREGTRADAQLVAGKTSQKSVRQSIDPMQSMQI